jgi:hypothetical protein
MSVRQNIPGRRLDGGHGPSGRTTVRQDFSKISRGNLSCLRASSGRDGTSSGRSHVRCKKSARPNHDRQSSGRLFFNTQFPYL